MLSPYLRRFITLSDNKLSTALAFVVGMLTGVAAWGFIRLIEKVQFWPPVPGESHFLGVPVSRWMIVAIPALGGLICGWIVQYWAPAAKGTGTADVIYALRRKGGKISPRYTFFKTLASIFTVCSGAAAGPEGPVVVIGAGLGSWFGDWREFSPEFMNSLVVAGAAAGFAAVFNAPISGVLFAIEVLLREFASQAFALVVLSTVTASVTTHLLLGNEVFVQVPPTYSFNHVAELGFYAILGILGAFTAKGFVWIYFFIEHQFERWIKTPMWRTTMGGILLGVMALFIPHVMGNGHVEIPDLILKEMTAPWPWALVLFLFIGKILACPLTITSGGSGGIFIPYLLIGALLGGLVGRGVHLIYPEAAPAGAYMLVGMGAVFAGITNAPFTAIILLFELTHDYSLILPLMFTVGITLAVARALDPESIDSRKLLKKGLRVHERAELRALENYYVGRVMTSPVTTILESMPLQAMHRFIAEHPHTGYPVVNAEGKMVGLLTYAELHDAFNALEPTNDAVIVRDIMRTHFPTVSPEDSLTEAVRRMHQHSADRIPVLDAEGKLAGLLTKSDILGIYEGLLS